VDECGRTPLLVAAETNSLAAVVALIKAGCDLNAVIAPPAATPATSDAPTLSLASQGDSALHVACQMGHVEVAETLVLADADLDLLNGRGLSAMQVVGELEEAEVKKILLDLLLL
jgi:ankyrin repeat protein